MQSIRVPISDDPGMAQLQEVRAALELITDERYAFNKSLASIAAGGDGDFSPHANKKRLGAHIT